MEEFKLIVASNLIRLRTNAGITQAELGEKISYSDKTVSKWERAESVPDTYALKQIADIFGVTVDFIITSHDDWSDKKVEEENKKASISAYDIITIIALVGELLVAFLIFTIFWILKPEPNLIRQSFVQIFVYALPVVLLTWLTLNSVWRKGKRNLILVSLLVLSLFAVVYVALFYATDKNPWQLFIVALPAELIVLLSFAVARIKRM